jgi:hypothetical protein
MDAQCLALALSGAIFCLTEDEQRAGKDKFLSPLGLGAILIGLAGITHAVAISWAIGIGLYFLLDRPFRFKRIAIFVLLAGLPTTLWLLYAVLSSKLDLLALQFLSHGTTHLASGNFFLDIWGEIERYRSNYDLAPLLPIAYFSSVIWFSLQRNINPVHRKKILLVFLGLFGFHTLAMTKGMGFYFLHQQTMMAICCGIMLDHFLPVRITEAIRIRERIAQAAIVALILNLIAAGIGGRLVMTVAQWKQRDYKQVMDAVRKTIPKGSIVWGPSEAWYAVEGAGSTLRLLGEPDPRIHDFIILPQGGKPELKTKARMVARFGEPLPLVFGKLYRASAEYSMEIWTWNDQDVELTRRKR